jgi:DNA-binding winged helix-turn-helix (wHTH) protein
MAESTDGSLRPRYRYGFGSVEFDESRFELRVAGLVVAIQRKPLDVLKYLLDHAGSVVSKDELLEHLWSGMAPVENVVGNAIAKLRAALGEQNANYIITQPRVGYRLSAPVQRLAIERGTEGSLILKPGRRVPSRENFQLEQPLAQTGPIQVWLARHEHTRERRLYKFALSGNGLARLTREVTVFRTLAEALSDLNEFVAIIDWNLESPPYFLEYEDGGEDLHHWADAGHLVRSSELQRLKLFGQLVDAVATANGVGVLHKDITPSSVLLTQLGNLWKVRLANFGSGGSTDEEALSDFAASSGGPAATPIPGANAVAGTQLYAAPEIARGQAPTAQCDVFALGVILYQLLSTDLRKGLSPGWERDISDPLLREDIAAATDGDPARRIGSALELSDRLRRLDERRQQRAEAEAYAQKATSDAAAVRLIRARRPWLIATFAALCLGLAAALLLSKRLLDAQRAQAQQFAVAQALNNFLTSNFIAVANPTETGRKDVTVVEATTNAAANIDIAFRNADPQVRGGLHAAMQNAFAGLSDVNASIAEGNKALEALNLARPADPRQVALVRVNLAALLAQSSRLDEATSHLKAAEDLIERNHITENAIIVRYIWAGARLAGFRMEPKAAVQGYRRAWELAKSDSSLPPELLDQVQFSYADALKMTSQFAEAQVEATELLARQRARLGATHAQPCFTSVLVASVAGYIDHESDSAMATARQAAACLSEKLGARSIRTASAYRVLADLQFQAQHYAEAAISYERLANSYADILGPNTLQTLNALMDKGLSLQFAGRLDDAEVSLNASLDVAQTALGWTAPTTETLRYHLADCKLDQRQTKDVDHLLAGLSVDALGAAQLEEDWDGRLAYQSGRLALFTGQKDRAIPILRRAAEIIAAKNPGGRITDASIRELIAEAERQH